MSVETDDRGRIYLPKDLREKHGERFRVLDLPDRVVLIPVGEDPLESAREAVGDAFAEKSVEEIRAGALDTAKAEIEAEVRERETTGDAADSE